MKNAPTTAAVVAATLIGMSAGSVGCTQDRTLDVSGRLVRESGSGGFIDIRFSASGYNDGDPPRVTTDSLGRYRVDVPLIAGASTIGVETLTDEANVLIQCAADGDELQVPDTVLWNWSYTFDVSADTVSMTWSAVVGDGANTVEYSLNFLDFEITVQAATEVTIDTRLAQDFDFYPAVEARQRRSGEPCHFTKWTSPWIFDGVDRRMPLSRSSACSVATVTGETIDYGSSCPFTDGVVRLEQEWPGDLAQLTIDLGSEQTVSSIAIMELFVQEETTPIEVHVAPSNGQFQLAGIGLATWPQPPLGVVVELDIPAVARYVLVRAPTAKLGFLREVGVY